MLYLGHFSFDSIDSSESPMLAGRGFFTAVVEASDIEDAMNRFEALIKKVHRDGDVLEGVCQVFLDACVEVRTLPESGLLSHFVEFSGDGRAMIFTPAPGVSEEFAAVYSCEEESAVTRDREPFLVFE